MNKLIDDYANHDDLCGLRYESLEKRIDRVESILVAGAALLITQLMGVILTLVILLGN